MDPVTLSGLIGAGGGLLESYVSGKGQSSANRANQNMAREQMAFQERMSSTALQRAFADARAAGLNPLYFKGGASTPGGSNSVSQNTMEGIKGTTSKALQARIDASNIKNLDAQNAQILSQTALNMATAKQVAAQTAVLGATKMQGQALIPVYNAAGEIVDWAVKKGRKVVKAMTEPMSNEGAEVAGSGGLLRRRESNWKEIFNVKK